MPSKKKTVAASPHAVVRKSKAVAAAAAAKKAAPPQSKKAAAAGAAAAAAELELALGGGGGPASTSGGDGGPSRVVYIGHLPHGFYEDQLKGYFSQFGAITRLRVSRNKKTAKARSYAFIEFASPDVAAIAADAMDGYIMFAQRLAVRVIPASSVHPALFKGANRKFAAVPWRRIEAARANAPRSEGGEKKRLARAAGRDRARAAAIKKAGIEYEYEPVKAGGGGSDGVKKAVGGGAKATAAAGGGGGSKRKAAAAAPAPAPKAAKKAAPAPAAPPAKKKAAAPAAAKAKPAARKAAAAPVAAAARASKRSKK